MYKVSQSVINEKGFETIKNYKKLKYGYSIKTPLITAPSNSVKDQV